MLVHHFNEQQKQLAAGGASASTGTLSATVGVPLRVVLGGTTVLNSTAFLADLAGGKLGATLGTRRDSVGGAAQSALGAALGAGAGGSSSSAFDPRRLAQLAAAPIASVLGTTSTTSKTL